MTELVSGWSDNTRVYLVERSGEDTRIRAVPAKWSAFVRDLEDDDRRFLQRLPEVRGLQQQGRHTRIEFADRYARKNWAWRIHDASERSKRITGKAGTELLEADVNPLRRMLSDHPSLIVSASPRLAYVDLETDSRKTFADAKAGMARILSWALVDHRGREFVNALQADDDAAERDLIERLLVALRDSDVVLAWNGSGFDFLVLFERAKKLGAMPNGLHPMWDRWCWLDMLEVYKKYNQHAHESGDEKASFKLDDVGHNVLGTGKDPFDARYTWEAWAADGVERQRLLRYNLKDTKLLPAIEAKTGYVALHLAVCHITRCFPDTNSLMATQQGDGFLTSLGAQHDHRWPTRTERDFESKYEGAYVMEPTRLGIVDDVHVADFASLYPTIMRTWNMSPDTLLGVLDPEHGTAPHCRLPTVRGSKFRTDRRGMLPLALDQLVSKRGEYTRKADAAEPMSDEFDHYKRLSQAFKVVANSFYGIVGSSYSRFFSREVAEGVTQTGAYLIKDVVVPAARAAGLDPFYGDTDSVFASGSQAAFADVVKQLNAGWDAVARVHGCANGKLIKLEFEKSFRRLVIVSAKHYAGAFSMYKGKPVGDDRKPEVKGLEYKRGDSVKLARTMQRELIGMLLERDVPEVARLQEWVERWRNRVLEGSLELEDIVLSQSVKSLGEYKERYTARLCGGVAPGSRRKSTKCAYDFVSTSLNDSQGKCPRCGTVRKLALPPVHVRVAKLLAERGEDIREGTRVEYLVVGTEPSLDAVPARDPGALERIDRTYYWERRVYPASMRVLEASFPTVVWVETAKQQRARLREQAIASKRGVVSDLPLFAGSAPIQASAK